MPKASVSQTSPDIISTAEANDDNDHRNTNIFHASMTTGDETSSREWRHYQDLFLVQTAIIITCSTALALGTRGAVWVHVDLWLTEKKVAFAVGIAVQIALIAPLELARMMCQILFWKGLVHQGQRYRSLITNWSVIYAHSYRGAEDLRGIGPIGGFLMLVYLIEVAILGAVGSLYYSVEVNALKATGTLPLMYPLQSTALIDKYAVEAFGQASESYFNFANLYDPMMVQAADANRSCDAPAPAGSWVSCHSVLASPLTWPYLSGLGKTQPDAFAWVDLVEGDVLRTRATEFGVRVTCAPSKNLYVQTDQSIFDENNTRTYLYTDVTGETYYATNTMWAAITPWMYTPQVQVITFGTGDSWQMPPIDSQGRMVFAMHAFNFPPEQYSNMTPVVIVYQDSSGARNSAAVLCTAEVTLATSSAEYEILQVRPGIMAKLRSTTRETTPVPYSLAPVPGTYGYSMAMFLTSSSTIIGCDVFPCSPSARDPPPFNLRMGFVKETQNASGGMNYSVDVQTMTSGMARFMARLLLNYAVPPANRTNLTPNQTTTFAEVHDRKTWQRIYTTQPCNIILATGITAAALLIVLHCILAAGVLTKHDWSAMWTTSSVLFLLQALPSQRLPNLAENEWRSAGLEKMREAADHVIVKGALDQEGKVRLKMREDSTKKDLQMLGKQRSKTAGSTVLFESVPNREDEEHNGSA
ncbi:hypothetical protein HDU86_002600 [Geranomyces michiganensis]|nr:hypothetical protein HDU86_002600 [Geranomyces michiganensis]